MRFLPQLFLFPAGMLVGAALSHSGLQPQSSLATPALAKPAAQQPDIASQAQYENSLTKNPQISKSTGAQMAEYDAHITRIIDGDTVEARVKVWLGHEIITRVRLRGIDAPELRGNCNHERALAIKASEALTALVNDKHVVLAAVGPDKYFGRVVARLRMDDGQDAGLMLLKAGLARPYEGRRRESWCAFQDTQ